MDNKFFAITDWTGAYLPTHPDVFVGGTGVQSPTGAHRYASEQEARQAWHSWSLSKSAGALHLVDLTEDGYTVRVIAGWGG